MRNIPPSSRPSLSSAAAVALLVLILSLTGCGGNGRDQARNKIKQAGRSFTADDFVKAAGAGDQGLLTAFLRAGMDRNSQDARGYTALMAAAEAGNTPLAKSLLDENAKPDLQNKEGASALLLATAKDHADTVRALVEANADTRVKDHSNWTPLMKAVYAGYKDVVDVLLKTSADQLKRDGQLDRALAVSALLGKLDIMRALLDHGANVNATIEKGQTALMYAATAGNADAATLLLDRGADPRLVNAESASASILALQRGHPDVAKLIDGRTVGGAATSTPANTPSPVAAAQTPSPAGAPTEKPSGAGADAASVAMERAWLKQNGIEPTNLLKKDTGQDDDGDGFTNDEELAAGTNPNDPNSHPAYHTKLRMKRVDGETFPVIFDGFDGKKARVTVREKSADGTVGGGRQFSVDTGGRVGDLPYVVTRVRRRNISEKDTGSPRDVSELTLSNLQTGQKITLVRAMPTNSPDATAIVTFGEAGPEMPLRLGQKFTIPRDPQQSHYEVLDIRPTQVILRMVETGQTVTVSTPDNPVGGATADPPPR